MYKIVITDHFKRQLKKLVKKDSELKSSLIFELKVFNKSHSIALGRGVFKLRIKRQASGKSGGYRLYVFVMEVDEILAPICIYSKNDCKNISANKLAEHLEESKLELEILLDD